MQLLQDQLTDPVKIVKQLQQVTAKMGASLPAVQRLGSEGRETLTKDSAVQRLGLMHLYVDSKADEVREIEAACKSTADPDAEMENAATEAEAEPDSLAAEGEDEDENRQQSQVAGEDVSGEGRAGAAQSVGAAAGVYCSYYRRTLHAPWLICVY